MKVTKAVIMDLLPLYSSGKASADTCKLIDDFLEQDLEMRTLVGESGLQQFDSSMELPKAFRFDQDAYLESRKKGAVVWLRRCYAWALALTLLGMSGFISVIDGHLRYRPFLLIYYPQLFIPCLLLAAGLWVNYFMMSKKVGPTN